MTTLLRVVFFAGWIALGVAPAAAQSDPNSSGRSDQSESQPKSPYRKPGKADQMKPGQQGPKTRPGQARSQPAVIVHEPNPPLGPEAIARISGREITKDEYLQFLFRQVDLTRFREFVDEYLIVTRAQELGVSVSEPEVAAQIDRMIQETVENRYRGDQALFERTLMQRYQTLESYRRWSAQRVRTDMLLERCILKERVVTDADVKEKFERMYGVGGVHSEIRHILILRRRPSGNSAEEGPSERAQQVMQMLEQDAGRFPELVQQFSDDRLTKRNDGYIPNYRAGMFGEKFHESVESLQSEGEITGPVESNRGFHIVQLVKRTTTRYEDVQEQVRLLLGEQAPASTERLQYRKKLRAAARIEM